MSFDLFGPTKKKDIKVGYISTDSGYIKGINILDANKYAFKNPGTIFILETRDSTRYLNINEVNRLTVEDIIPSNTAAEGTCEGVIGLSPQTLSPDNQPGSGKGNDIDPRSVLPRGSIGNLSPGTSNIGSPSPGGGAGSGPGSIDTPVDELSSVGNPIVVITGGGGVGAKALPIIGDDGSVLDIKLVYGGFGYRSPPRVSIIDINKTGDGVVATSEIGISTGVTLLTYQDEDDFEEYNFDPLNGDPELSGYSNKVGVDGENIGIWDPTLYASLEQDPIEYQIAKYQEFLDKGINPFWSTRKNVPALVAFSGRKDRVVHKVQHPAWGGEVSVGSNGDDFVDLDFEVFSQGGAGGNKGLAFNFTAEDGSHKFQFKADDFKESTKTKVKKKVKKNIVYRVSSSGSHKGKGTEQGLIAGLGKNAKEIKGNKKGSKIFADLAESSNDNDDIQIGATQGIFTASNERKQDGHTTNDLTYLFRDTSSFEGDSKNTSSFMNNYAISPVPASDVPGSDFAGKWCTFEWEENFPHTGEYTFRGMADNIGKIYLDNDLVLEAKHFRGDPLPKNIVKKTIEEGLHKIRVDLHNIPIREPLPKPLVSESGEYTITYRGLNSGSTKTISGEKSYAIRTEGESSTAGRRVVNSGKEIQFDDNANNGFDENASLKIESTSPGVSAKFNSDGTQMIVKGRGDVSLKFSWDDNSKTSGLAVGTLKVGNGEKVSWTTRQRGEKGSDKKTIFVGENDSKEVIGQGGFDVSKDLKQVKMRDSHGDDINATFSIKSSTNNARFSSDGKKLQYDGAGDITLELKWDDNPNTYGVAIETIEVGGVKLTQKGTVGSDTKKLTIKSKKPVSTSTQSQSNVETIFDTIEYINKADRKLWRTNLYGGNSFINEYGVCPFNTVIKTNEDYGGTHVIRWENITFPENGKYNIEVEVDDKVKLFIGNRSGDGDIGIGNGLTNIEDGGDEVIIEKDGFVENSSKGTGKSKYSRFFKKGRYRIRAELYQKPGGDFGFGGSDSFGGGEGLTARFQQSGPDTFLVMDGVGTATVDFSLRMDDNPGISGHSLGSIRIGDVVQLKRSKGEGNKKYKEVELITGSGTFTGGQRYKVVIVGANVGAGSRVRRDFIEFDDNAGNGFDVNGTLKIGRLTNRQGAPDKGLNPMAIAIRIKADVEETIISPRTWNQNPMGAAFTIDAGLPPIPISPKPVSEGRCAEYPTWTTRFPGGKESWWPVTHKSADGKPTWSKFTNTFAISPIPPLITKNSDGTGVVYSNSWQVNISHSGYYALKGTVDNGGRILVDDIERMRGGYFNGEPFSADDVPQGKLAGFKNISPPLHKFYLDEGQHKVTVEVENKPNGPQEKIEKKIFNTKDWRNNNTNVDRIPVRFDVYGQGSDFNTAINFVFTSEDGTDSFTFKPKDNRSKTYSYFREVSILPGTNYKVQAVATGTYTQNTNEEKTYPIRTEGESSTAGRRVVNSGKEIQFDDNANNGFDENASLKIESTSPGVSAKFSDDAKELIVKGNGNVSLKFSWDDNSKTSGLAVGTLLIGRGDKVTWRTRQKGEKGSDRKTISVGGSEKINLIPQQGTLKTGSFTKGGSGLSSNEPSDIIFADIIGSVDDTNDLQVRASVGVFVPSNKRSNVQGTSGSGTQRRDIYDLTFRVESNTTPQKPKKIGSVTYNGPRLFAIKSGAAANEWSKFMLQNSVSPFIPPINENNPEIANAEFTYIWKNVDFFESGKYKYVFQSDNEGYLFINGNKIVETRSNFRGEPIPGYTEIPAGKFEVKVVCRNRSQAENILTGNNPTGFALNITKDVVISESSQSWRNNPIGISAILIPPPCPKVVVGKGIVTDITVSDPGNGFPKPPQGGVPTIVTIKKIEPTLPGINYDPDDKAIVDGVVLPITVDNFGRVTSINTPPGTLGGGPGAGGGTGAGGGPDAGGGTGAGGGPGAGGGTAYKSITNNIGSYPPTNLGTDWITTSGTGPAWDSNIAYRPGDVVIIDPSSRSNVRTQIIVTSTPLVEIPSLTGVGFRGTPIMQTTIVPEGIFDPADLIQVTDLVGLKQTGYVNGKPYYGSVFSDNGELFAGVFETTGDLIPVYASLQESIDNRVATRPSAILRQGTDTNSNNPRLNIPGTPQNLI